MGNISSIKQLSTSTNTLDSDIFGTRKRCKEVKTAVNVCQDNYQEKDWLPRLLESIEMIEYY